MNKTKNTIKRPSNSAGHKPIILLTLLLGAVGAIAAICPISWGGPDQYFAIETDCTPNSDPYGRPCSPGCTQRYESYFSGCVTPVFEVNVHCEDSGQTTGSNWAENWWPCRLPEFEDLCEGCDLSAEPQIMDQGTHQVKIYTDVPGCGG